MDVSAINEVRRRASRCCEYCHAHEELSALRFHVEHIIARQHGGGDTLDNLALACPDCNWLKGTNLTSIDPDTAKVTPLFHPRRAVWGEHFSVEGLRLIGASPAGRTTIWLPDLNSSNRIHHRMWLVRLKLWP